MQFQSCRAQTSKPETAEDSEHLTAGHIMMKVIRQNQYYFSST